jgi:site-specific recombinase XerC
MKKRSDFIGDYLEAHENLWAYSTWKSTKARLTKLGTTIDLEPEKMYHDLESVHNLAPYTIKTTLSVVSSYFDWLAEKGHFAGNPLLGFKKKLNRMGKQRNAYKRRVIGRSFSEVSLEIEKKISNKAIRDHALFLLNSGLRISETYKVDKDNYVVGKGNKRRKVFAPVPSKLVTPHRLRLAFNT